MEDRVLMLCLDGPEFLGTFLGAIKPAPCRSP